jgi:hypothetical protein
MVLWELALPDGLRVQVERMASGRVLWRLCGATGRAEVVGWAADEQAGRLCAVLCWRDATGLRSVPEAVREAALRGAA